MNFRQKKAMRGHQTHTSSHARAIIIFSENTVMSDIGRVLILQKGLLENMGG